MARSISLNIGILTCARISAQPTFIPAHVNKSGYLVQDRILVPVMTNALRGGDDGNGKRDSHRLVAWGGYAQALAKSGSIGKALDVIYRLNTYQGVAYKDRQPVMMPDGQPLTITKTSLTVLEMAFGEESAKMINAEVQYYPQNPNNIYCRPPQWNVVGSPDEAKFKENLMKRQQVEWDGQSNDFGYATVVMPNGAQRVLNAQERAQMKANGAASLGIPLATGKGGASGASTAAVPGAAPQPATAGAAGNGYPANAQTVASTIPGTSGNAGSAPPMSNANAGAGFVPPSF